MGIAPAFVVPLPRKDFPKTTSGKIQRSYLKKTLEAGGFKELLKDLDVKLGSANTIPNWFFKRVWQAEQLGPSSLEFKHEACLLFADNLGLAAHVCTKLKSLGHR